MVGGTVAFWGCGFLAIAVVVSIILGRAASSLTQRRDFPTREIPSAPATVGAFFLIVFGCVVFYVWCSNNFYCDRGFADYSRMPLKYPYQISSIDSHDEGCLSTWPDKGSCISAGITHYAIKDSVMVGRIYSRRRCPDCPEQWFSFNLDTGDFKSYSDKEAFAAACTKLGLAEEPMLIPLRDHFRGK